MVNFNGIEAVRHVSESEIEPNRSFMSVHCISYSTSQGHSDCYVHPVFFLSFVSTAGLCIYIVSYVASKLVFSSGEWKNILSLWPHGVFRVWVAQGKLGQWRGDVSIM